MSLTRTRWILLAGLCILLLAALPTVLAAGPAPAAPDPAITALMNAVQTDKLTGYVADLSGERAVTIGGTAKTIRTRYSGTAGMADAADYLSEFYAGLGLQVEAWPYGTAGWTDVVATQPGYQHPEQVYIICAHFDDTSNNRDIVAPGADDNASGTAAVMEAARVLSAHTFAYTIRYINFSGEEQGLWGSLAYAHQSRRLGEQIKGAIDLDMIAWNGDGVRDFAVHARDAGSQALAQQFKAVAEGYGLGVQVNLVTGGAAMGYSDHDPFWGEGYAALLAIEDEFASNGAYHSTGDTLSRFDLELFTAGTKAGIGTLATLAGRLPDTTPPPTPTPTPTPWPSPACPDHLVDGDFEAGAAGGPWRSTVAGQYSLFSTQLAHAGAWGAWLGRNNSTSEALCQTLVLPAGARSPSIELWWQMWTDEHSHAFDWLDLQVQPAGGTPETVARLDDGALQHRWEPLRASSESYAGKTIDVCFVAHSDNWDRTYFFLDDVQVNYCTTPWPHNARMPLILK